MFDECMRFSSSIVYCTLEMALTRVDLPCATWPIVPLYSNQYISSAKVDIINIKKDVPILMVAYLEMTSGERGDRLGI